MKSNSLLKSIFTIIFVFIIIGGFIFLVNSKSKQAEKNETENTTTETAANLREYKNDQLGISFSYPEEYGDVKEKFGTNQDTSKQFIGTFSNNDLTFGTPTTDELSDSVNNQYDFQYGIGLNINDLESKNKNGVSFNYVQSTEEAGKFHAVFILKNPTYITTYKTVEFYGEINDSNQKIVDSVKIY